MSLKTEILAVGVRYVAERLNLTRPKDSFSDLLDTLMGVEPVERRIARAVEEKIDNAADIAKAKIHDRAEKRRTTFYPYKK